MSFRYAGFADEASKKLAEQIEVTQRAGWPGIELRTVEDTNIGDLSDAQWDRAFGMMQDAGLAVASFGGQIANWSRPITGDFAKDRDELVRSAPRMRQAGCQIIRIMSYPNDKDNPWPRAKWRNEVCKRLGELAKIAEGEGVILAHENCSGYASLGPDEFLDVYDAVDSPAFQWLVDTGNNSVHDDDIEATWRFYEACKHLICHVHIKCYKRGDDGKLHTCFPDEDPVQARILGDLKAKGYAGWVSIEPHIAAAIHTGRQADGQSSVDVYYEYTQRLEKLVDSL